MAFLRNLLASILGLFIFTGFCLLILIGILVSSETESSVPIFNNSVLHIKLDKPILEQKKSSPLDAINLPFMTSNGNLGLKEIILAINNAKTDKKISGILIESPNILAGFSTTKAIRDALLDFKESGKLVFSHSDYYSGKAYYLNSVADQISISPSGGLDFKGLSSNITFFKGFFDKFGIEVDVFRVGDYKSAVEPFFRKSMSEDSREQTSSLLNEINDLMLGEIATSRSILLRNLKKTSNDMSCRLPEDAVRLKLIDGLAYKDEVLDTIKTKLALEENKKLNLVNLTKYLGSIKPNPNTINRQKIAIVIAEGEIISGKSKDGKIGDESLIKNITELRNNNNVKAIVLRVNSPGGSALASDNIWREISLTSKKKPVIASMSDLAASGGYYISMACDTIVAEANTVTGSIGIFGLRFNIDKLLTDKLGITNDFVSTGKYSDMDYPTKTLSQVEKDIIQRQVNKGYETFTTKAASDRKMPLDSLLKYASGRVWTGSQALKHHLIDTIGNIETAISIAATKAKLNHNEYALEYYPKPKNQFEQIIEDLSGNAQHKLFNNLEETEKIIKEIQRLKQYEKIQTRLPYDIRIN